uniref:HMG box domain-containing protein n=1 Tax=Chrysotila carterae TaxID=13221 RepID=A0A7S4ETN5_CHRCT|mmetsp:Transcript_22449/g.49021  ORF Transcript_22449/g.49021 Transcript_22449/m.49021 type:complete len:213 (+) Transcript_22449:199-837(+)
MPSVAEMISEALSDAPQSADVLYGRIVTAYGKAAPSLSSIQSTLCAKGEKLGRKLRGPGKRVSWVRFDSKVDKIVPDASSSLSKGIAKPKKSKDAASDNEPRGAKRARALQAQEEAREKFRRRLHEHLSKPFSAFALFAFAQRSTLKRQKPNTTLRELVKAVGERWLLLSEAQQREYELMAEEDKQRALREANGAQGDEGQHGHASIELQAD